MAGGRRRIKVQEDNLIANPVRMKPIKIISIACSILIMLASACNADSQTAAPTPDINHAASTIVALTFQAATESALLHPIANTPALPLSTPTTQPTLFINNNVQCRTGINQNFRVVTTFTPGTTVDMLGRDSAASAWLIQVPNTPQTCWILAQDASPGGSYENLPDITPQPGTQSVPGIPGSIFYSFSCTHPSALSTVITRLSWTDTANDANGFRIYRFGIQIGEVPASTLTFSDTTTIVFATQLSYGVEAYNDAGASPRRTISFICK
jgi:hypothetical protein